MIQLRGVSCSYDGAAGAAVRGQGTSSAAGSDAGRCAALSGVDLDVERGAMTAFIGPNGSGKSTLLKLLAGVVPADAGSYVFDGEPVTRRSLKDQAFGKRLHQRVGLLFQNPDSQLFCASVEEEVAFGPRQMGLSEEDVAARVDDCCGLLGIRDLRGRAPWHLSEGEKRKTALAAVLSLNPEVLLLDEPMNGLDPRTRRFLRDLLLSLHAAGKTVLCATHDFRHVDGIFRQAVVISEDHRIIREGRYDEVVADRDFLEANNLW